MTSVGVGKLVVLRGNSGSGKSTVARRLQERFDRGTCAVVAQDVVRRTVLREHDRPDAFNIELIETIAGTCLARDLIVVAEGIFDARRYGAMLDRLSSRASAADFYVWDLEFAETVRRHGTRPQSDEFTAADMRTWYYGRQPLSFVAETEFDASVGADDAVARICADLESART